MMAPLYMWMQTLHGESHHFYHKFQKVAIKNYVEVK